MKKTAIKSVAIAYCLLVVPVTAIFTAIPSSANAADQYTAPTTNLSDPKFRLVVCDGPDLSRIPSGKSVEITINGVRTTVTGGQQINNYMPCNFNTLMLTVQHFINVAIAVGVLISFGTFCFIGYLYITGVPANINKAKSMFPKIFTGFIIMLAAWFIVYQLLSWLGANKAYTSLLSGAPQNSSNQ